MAEKITICCLKNGAKYGGEYVNILEAMVARAVKDTPYNFICFTDNGAGVNPWIRTAPLPYAAPGWWPKMGLYQEGLPGVTTDKILFLDLDVVICGALDELLAYPADLAMARDWPEGRHAPGRKENLYGNSSVIMLRVGAASDIWARYNAAGCPRPAGTGDQEWINDNFPGRAALLPERFVQSYKLHNLAHKRPDCSVVMFHGRPKPPECGGWVKELWHE